MKTYVPEYYRRFHCIAGRCRHSCCIGWEIDIDEDTFDLYQSIGGGFGRRLKNNIEGDDPPHFRLGEHERCPFLTCDGLCDIILTLGEGALCQICDDHPRFRNYYSDRIEMGLGLCCEAAADLILRSDGADSTVLLEDDGEDEEVLSEEELEFFRQRETLMQTAGDRTLSVEERMERILALTGSHLPDRSRQEWADVFSSLECLDPGREAILSGASEGLDLPGEFDLPTENLLKYFLYRHLAGCLEDDRLGERAAFAVLSCRMIRWMCGGILAETGELSIADMVECARLYSSEYEYSEENLEELLNLMEASS